MTGIYSPLLVTLSCIIAIMASYTALDLAGRIRACKDAVAGRYWLTGGAFAMGTGIWAMHFIGMLAFMLPENLGYDISFTLLSMLAAVIASGIALAVVNTGELTLVRLLAGGLAMGTGICAMHYVGMAAMKMQPPISYSGPLVGASIFIAMSASVAALWIAFRVNPRSDSPAGRPPIWQRMAAAVMMGAAIAGVHYTGMAAARFPTVAQGTAASLMSAEQLATLVAVMSISVMLIAVLLSVHDKFQSQQTRYLTASLQAANEELQFMLLHDPLTRLPNRVLLEDRVSRIMARVKRSKLEFAFLYIDLDRFKSVNDLMGHHIGDAVIQAAAKRITETLREMDTVARVGGDEFMVVLGESENRQDFETVARRIGIALSDTFVIQGHEIRISASIGISIYPQHGTDIQQLMAHADAAMYYAKDVGKNNYQVFEAGMNIAVERRHRISRNLALAIGRTELTLAYQPKVAIASGGIVGVEALARWHDRELGIIGPEEFIPIAEDTGLILSLGEWVLCEACTQMKRWEAQGEERLQGISVNVSTYQLNHQNFVEVVKGVLEKTGLEAGRLELEVTESAVMQNPERACAILTELHQLGVKIAIDDFGTGYSNLSQLKRFPIDYLKIDQSFISGIATDIQNAALVKTIVAMAYNLNLEVIVEGVETEEQLAFVKNLGAHMYQGYLCSEPLSVEEFQQFLGRTGEKDKTQWR
ncbi:putative bifunctional diguanylate cyclase/phosphodiesterase [Kineobactrum salinum]|uniref:cyclic-guanylate-specific phosphodiesterase n=1 Tax=Kineobactrum salinum TaxID=2708301 RepID=A0A6C0U237_9GAMM|nr:EAL domain-containing protein [Kineobactrum salinum]QIB65988.1 EAL domain-containing protein [Kineobactrum salinum]